MPSPPGLRSSRRHLTSAPRHKTAKQARFGKKKNNSLFRYTYLARQNGKRMKDETKEGQITQRLLMNKQYVVPKLGKDKKVDNILKELKKELFS